MTLKKNWRSVVWGTKRKNNTEEGTVILPKVIDRMKIMKSENSNEFH